MSLPAGQLVHRLRKEQVAQVESHAVFFFQEREEICLVRT